METEKHIVPQPKWWTIRLVLLVVVIVACVAIYLRLGDTRSTVKPIAQCPSFTSEHHTCSFGDVAVWVSTGTVLSTPKALCFDRLPSAGDYTLLNSDGAVDDGTGKVQQAQKGFRAPRGQTRSITYWLADTMADCART